MLGYPYFGEIPIILTIICSKFSGHEKNTPNRIQQSLFLLVFITIIRRRVPLYDIVKSFSELFWQIPPLTFSDFYENSNLYVTAILIMVWALIRCYSRNIEKRYAERESYLQLRNRWKAKVLFRKKQWEDRKTYRYFRCKNCKTVMRIPKGKGKVEVRCPVCRETILTRS